MTVITDTFPDYDPEKLLASCGLGNEKALQDIYKQEAGRMLGVAQRILKRRALAEEALHDTFVLIWRHAHRFNLERGAALPWMYTILRNRALTILRGERRLETSDAPIAENVASEDDDPETILSKLSDAKALRHCLEKLEAPRRQAVLLAFVNGLTHAELATRLNMPLGTLKSWIRRSLVTLKECLG